LILENSGIEDIGNFKEGFCFKLVSKTLAIWNICADSYREKVEWMKKIKEVMPKPT
jgi:hypothetical protein